MNHWLSGTREELGTAAKNLLSYWQETISGEKQYYFTFFFSLQNIEFSCTTFFEKAVFKEKCTQDMDAISCVLFIDFAK